MAKESFDANSYKKKLIKQVTDILQDPEPQESPQKGSKPDRPTTQDYEQFRRSYLPTKLGWYEKACNIAQKSLNVGVDKKQKKEMQESIQACHLNITPEGAISFSFLAPLLFLLISLLLTVAVPFALGSAPSLFFMFMSLIIALAIIIPLQKLPKLLADNWRMRASNQMVLAIFYMVSYMRHTSNMEWAVDFAAEHLEPPLSLDFKKILWNLHTRKFNSLKESLDDYLVQWREYNLEFVESVHLIESSLYETNEDRRISALEKSLDLMLDETYEKMLHYAQNLKGPLTTLHMLGIVLPILGLVVLPLMVSFVSEIKWYHLAMLYNVLIPGTVYYLGRVLLSRRPSGYGETNMDRINKAKNLINPKGLAIFVFLLFSFIGFLPLITHAIDPTFDIHITWEGVVTTNVEDDIMIRDSFLGYKQEVGPNGEIIEDGPFGIGATILGIVFILGLGLSIGLYNKMKTEKLIKIRENAKKLEREFAGALFQLGNRLGDGIPAEAAFGRVAKVMEGTKSGNFFQMVSDNITRLGIGMKDAIFDKKKGALNYYPSNMIESSMKVLMESSKKGSAVASKALINVSEYIKQIRRVDERLKDLMADVISSMQSQIAFLTPAIAGIVVGITSMIGNIMGNIEGQVARALFEGQDNSAATLLSSLSGGIPAFWFQLMVGIYVVQIAMILTVLINGIINGSDSLNEKYMIGKNVLNATILYVVITATVVLIFNYIAGNIMQELVLTT